MKKPQVSGTWGFWWSSHCLVEKLGWAPMCLAKLCRSGLEGKDVLLQEKMYRKNKKIARNSQSRLLRKEKELELKILNRRGFSNLATPDKGSYVRERARARPRPRS